MIQAYLRTDPAESSVILSWELFRFMFQHTDPTYRNALREAIGIGVIWLACTVYCCAYSYVFGYIRSDRPLDVNDVAPIWGIPSWVVWGVFAPWIVCSILTFWYAGVYMADDDLGRDHSLELERDIREGGGHE